MYDPKIGRWISQDPIGFDAGDANLYRYVENNPVNLIDPSGEASQAQRRWLLELGEAIRRAEGAEKEVERREDRLSVVRRDIAAIEARIEAQQSIAGVHGPLDLLNPFRMPERIVEAFENPVAPMAEELRAARGVEEGVVRGIIWARRQFREAMAEVDRVLIRFSFDPLEPGDEPYVTQLRELRRRAVGLGLRNPR